FRDISVFIFLLFEQMPLRVSHHLTLEALPKENIYRILSNLGLQDRKRVRECSKTMKEAIQQSDLFIDRIELRFGKIDENCYHICIVCFFTK
ncbi:hypothetical protein PFISCL1PPCAC_17957, partial [Pristionchus fissidentatus]